MYTFNGSVGVKCKKNDVPPLISCQRRRAPLNAPLEHIRHMILPPEEYDNNNSAHVKNFLKVHLLWPLW